MKTLILGHSQVKYFHEYVSSEDIKCISDSGCLIVNLLYVPGASDEIKSKQVS